MVKSYRNHISSQFFGMLLLVAGLGAGIVLVTQDQIFDKNAQVVNYNKTCTKCTYTEKNVYYACNGLEVCKFYKSEFKCQESWCSITNNIVTDCGISSSCIRPDKNLCSSNGDCKDLYGKSYECQWNDSGKNSKCVKI